MSDLTPTAKAERERIVALLTKQRDRARTDAGDRRINMDTRRAREAQWHALNEAIAAIQGDDNAG